MFTFLLVVQALVAALLVTVILMQKSEGGGLGVGGSPAGFMSARGAADFLTRSTTVLAGIFVTLSIVLAVIASIQHRPSDIDTSLVKQAPQAPTSSPASAPAPATGQGSAGGRCRRGERQGFQRRCPARQLGARHSQFRFFRTRDDSRACPTRL